MLITASTSSMELGPIEEWLPDLAHTVCHATQTILGWAELLAEETTGSIDRRSAIASIASSARQIADTVVAVQTALDDDDGDVHALDVTALLALARTAESTGGLSGAELQVTVPDLPLVLCEPTAMTALVAVLLGHFRCSARAGSSVVVDATVTSDEAVIRISGHLVEFTGLIAKVTALLARRARVAIRVSSAGETRTVAIGAARASCEDVDDQLAPTRWLVLHLDDDLATRELVAALLSSETVSVLSAGSLDEARRMMTLTTPDLLVLDGRVGADDGLDLLREVRDGASNRSLAAILLSAQHSPERQRAAAELGATTLQKPISRRELVDAVEEALSTW